jgi:hypothetical protein
MGANTARAPIVRYSGNEDSYAVVSQVPPEVMTRVVKHM